MTKIFKVDPLKPEEDKLQQAAEVLKKGGLVIFPTETVYGIAANLLNKKAIGRLYRIKQRPKDKPFSILIANREKVDDYAKDIPIAAYKLMDKFWPGPLTLILRAKSDDEIGLRLPDCEIALHLISSADVPLAAPSANLTGAPAPVTFEEAIKDLNGKVDLAIDAGRTKLGIESSIVDLTINPAQILREGAIKKDDIEKIIHTKTVLFICTGNTCRSVMAKYLLEKKLKEQNRDDVEVSSAGILLLAGTGPAAETLNLLKGQNIDASGHISKRVSIDLVKRADLILVMEKLHEDELIKLAPEAKNRVFLLKEFAKIEDNNLNIEDPIGRPREFYEATFYTIKEAIERVAKII